MRAFDRYLATGAAPKTDVFRGRGLARLRLGRLAEARRRPRPRPRPGSRRRTLPSARLGLLLSRRLAAGTARLQSLAAPGSPGRMPTRAGPCAACSSAATARRRLTRRRPCGFARSPRSRTTMPPACSRWPRSEPSRCDGPGSRRRWPPATGGRPSTWCGRPLPGSLPNRGQAFAREGLSRPRPLHPPANARIPALGRGVPARPASATMTSGVPLQAQRQQRRICLSDLRFLFDL